MKMVSTLSVLVLAIAGGSFTATAQGPGRGISKSTWAASDPVNTCYSFFLKYLPVEDAVRSIARWSPCDVNLL